MKKLILIFILFLTFAVMNNLMALDTESIKYFPLSIGNSWVYDYTAWNPPLNGRCRVVATGSFISNGKTYFNLNITEYPQNSYCGGPSLGICRIDSLTGNFMLYSPGQGCGGNADEKLIDSLNAKFGDSATVNCSFRTGCSDTALYDIFGASRPSKVFQYSFAEGGQTRRYVKNIGLVYSSSGANTSWCFYNLRGCIINSIVYGDTSLTGIENITNETPGEYLLSQNYPNPFNPNTKIKFYVAPPLNLPLSGGDVTALAGAVGVRLMIYDVLGREVATLVNQQMQPGSYSVDWDGTNYPSGVYFYKLVVGDAIGTYNTNNGGFVQTKKMVLIK